MNETLSQLLQLGPGIAAGATGNGGGMQAFMEAYQRTNAMLDERERQQMTFSQGQQDRQRTIERQDASDRMAADTHKQRMEAAQRDAAIQKAGLPNMLAEQAGAAETPDDAQRMIETILPGLMQSFGQDVMGYGMPAVAKATQTITARQKRQLNEWLQAWAKKKSEMGLSEQDGSDPLVTQIPSHLRSLIGGRAEAKLSELEQISQVPVTVSRGKSTPNPTEASIAMEAAGGDPKRAFEMLNPPKPEGGGKTTYRFLKDRDGNIIEWPTDQPAPRGSRPYNETTQRQEDTNAKRDETVATAAEDALALVNNLRSMPGMSGAVGAKGPMSMFGLLERPISGSSAAGYRAKIDELKSKLTIPAMQQMRGLGAMSDREFRTMSDSVTALSSEMSESLFLQELAKIEQALKSTVERLRVKSAAPAMNEVGGGDIKVGSFTVRVKP